MKLSKAENIILLPAKVLGAYGSSSQSHSSLCSFDSEPYPPQNFRSDFNYCYETPSKLAIVHHQFESIHPFYDGNGRTGRIICVLYLVLTGRLDLPILYLSRYITHNKGEYYRLIQAIRDKNDDNAAEWEAWILFMLKGVEETAIETTRLVKGISKLMAEFKSILRPKFGKQYRHELLNNLFFHPYTKVEFLEKELAISRPTATRYLNGLVETGLIDKVRIGRSYYYMNLPLMDLFLSVSDSKVTENVPPIESVLDSI